MSKIELRPGPDASADDCIALCREEVWDDRIGWGLSEVLASGRDRLGLEGEALVAFVRRAIAAMVDEGARPRHQVLMEGSLSAPHEPGPLHYGSDTPEEIVDGVTTVWVVEGMQDLAWGDFRFSMPEVWTDE